MPLHLQHHCHYDDGATASFSWSDFPLIVQGEDCHDCFAVRAPPPATCPNFSTAPFYTSLAAPRTISSQTRTTKKKPTKIQFAACVEIRTHSLVLGEHPWCEDGLALDLGWEYNESVVSRVNQEHSPRRHESNIPRRRSYLERKRLLLEVGGYTENELKQKNNFGSDTAYLQQHRLSRVGSVMECLNGSGGIH
eukprot:CAMPEP_0172365772 /NCGR_PEP_ID=MMETSP1060-20121228/11903_1 /TAXON_ID=37318 /ORGANISM="Pseudo-nitzschia pungens, Strain cf. cingulata" /LENGTH=192 /DNA_ID=CAMNT_0013089289 /DNA_START=168 /DNA_END=746 /DNA_ORIENTATION=-